MGQSIKVRMRGVGLAAAALLSLAAGASAQDHAPVTSKLAARPLPDAAVRELSQSLSQRSPAQAITVNSDSLRAAARAQSPAVDVRGMAIVPAPRAVQEKVAPPSASKVTRVEVVATTPRDEVLLKDAIAAHDSLQPALSVANSSIIPLPGVVRMEAQNGSELQLKPFILVNQPLQQIASGQFEGELLIGVTEIVDSTITKHLPSPLQFEIAGAVRSVPDKVIVDTTSPPFRHVKVIVDAIQDQAAKLRVISVLDRNGTEVSLPLAGELSVEPESGSIEGFGLETTRVHVGTAAVPSPRGRMVTLRVDPSGYLDKGTLALDENGMAETVLRSDGIGEATIKASSPELKSATSRVRFRLPIRTFGAALLGGLLGAFVAFSTGDQPHSKAWKPVLGGTLFGVLVFAFWAVGMNILPVTPKVTVGAAAVFAVAGLAAWLGPSISSWRGKLPGGGGGGGAP